MTVSGLPTGRLPGCTHPPFRLTQVRKPGAVIIVAAQALPELKPNVAQFRSTGVSPQMQNAFIKRFNRTYDLMNL
ncbi:hypothetical protein LA04_05625 [Enterobacter sp. UCD-UG_FMILLET]|jgi:hypothetical protein|nr:hypothetical protein LA04_05625 [Enterobacter sp. UCD-UG_FMILLET]